jgi:hypothetical protein
VIRSISFLIGVALVAAPAAASNYSATLASPTSARFIARDITWTCGAAACQGATNESRPLVLCQSLAKRAGRVESFLVDGRAIAPSDLERCNASAKVAPGATASGK